MLEKLKFWNKEEFQPMPEKEPFSDPLAQPSPDGFPPQDPLQSSFGQDQNADQSGFAQQSTQGQYPQQSYPPATPFPGALQPPSSYAQQQYPPSQQPFSAPQQSYPPPQEPSRETELILAKLDAIKSELDALHQRVRTIEGRTDPAGAKAQQRYW